MSAKFPLPSAARALPVGSRSHTLTVSTLGILRRELCGDYRNIQTYMAERLDSTVDDFIEHIVGAGHDMGWTLHFEFGSFCRIQDRACWEEICIGAARRWVRLDSSPASWIAISCTGTPGSVVFGLRSFSVDSGPKIVRARLVAGPDDPAPFRFQLGFGTTLALGKRWTSYLSVAGQPSDGNTRPDIPPGG